MDRDGSQRAVTFVSSQHVGDRVLSFTLFVVHGYFIMRNIVTLLSPVSQFMCCLQVVATRHEPSHLLAARYGLGVLDMYATIT